MRDRERRRSEATDPTDRTALGQVIAILETALEDGRRIRKNPSTNEPAWPERVLGGRMVAVVFAWRFLL